MKLHNFILTVFLALSFFVKAQENTNKRFIINADKIAKGFLNSVFGERTVATSIKLSEKRSMIRNDRIYKYYMLSDYLNDYKPTSVWLVYNFLYKGDTVFTMQFDINDSLKIENNEDYMAVDIPQLIGWKNVIDDNFKFNYDKLKAYIKKDINIDTAYKDITIGYKAHPNSIKQGETYFIETKFYWLITIYSKTRNADNTIDNIQVKREIRIDVDTGEILLDKPLEKPFPWAP